MTRPVLGRPAPRRPPPQAVGPRSRARSVFEVQSQQPGNFSLHVQFVCAVCNSCSRRATAPRARAPSHPAGCVRPPSRRLLRGQLPQRARAPRLAPSRQMRAVQPLAAKQAAHLAGLCAAIRLLQNPQPILCGELAPLRLGHNLRVRGRSGAPALGASSLRSSTPRAGTETSFNVIESLSAVIGFHLHRPTEITKVAGVSVTLAERGPRRGR